MGEESNAKWEGKAIAEITKNSAEQVWPYIEDFCNIHKLIPLDICNKVEGIEGQPGLTRYCATTIKGEADDAEIKINNWVNEKLLTIDPVQRCLSYEVGQNNMGFKSYVSTIKVLATTEDAKVGGCKLEWGFVCDPVEGWRFQDLNSYIDSTLQGMAKKIEAACSESI
ncbi:putative polyketide cyclase/dehydrase, START-like domain-containing protein [Lupinus albus]|uniref:Putative polyketide cyclase/dehydrase, START-like domain-containing protein n=1 Tax=Lupinus albus TaxID=3870 RepID=A0A6A4Q5V0_LUPAL|nr:putative polyketide cyclase/dehydrase, START-like domain-containing protein [Lupinus albus]